MTTTTKPDRGSVQMNSEECKGCGLCVEACPPKVLSLAEELNHYGYHPAVYLGHGCTGCRICFFVCPEPGGIRVLRRELEPARGGQSRVPSGDGCRRRRARARQADCGAGPNCPPAPLLRPPARFRRIARNRPPSLRGVHRAPRHRAAPPRHATQRRRTRTAGGPWPLLLARGRVESQPTERGIRLRALGARR